MNNTKLHDNMGALMGLALGQSQHLDDFIQVGGRVTATYEDIETGETGILHHKPNLIVNIARENMCYLLSAPQTQRHIKAFRLGTRGHNLSTGDILSPVAPVVGDSALKDTNPFIKDIGSFALLPASGLKNEVQFSVSIEANEANGANSTALAYTEAALYTARGEIFCRESFAAIVKTPTRRINFTWSILF